MPPNIPLWLLLVGLLLAAGALLGRAARTSGLPAALFFLALGVAAGALRNAPFRDMQRTVHLGSAALALILFDGGLNTPVAAVRAVLGPASLLATAGVALTAALTAAFARLTGLDWISALLLGAIVSSTDAAAVFSVLRGSGVILKRRVGRTLEVESGLNDAMAAILTIALTEVARSGGRPGASAALQILWQLACGGGLGALIGFAGRALLRWARLPAGGLYPVLSLGVALVAFGLPTLAQGSGFLAAYVAGLVLGDGEVPYRAGLLRVHDAAAWIAQIAMFFVLGLLARPLRVWEGTGAGITVGLALAFIARPVAVFLCLAPFRYRWREVVYIAWVGLRGAVPIILAAFPVLAAAPGADRVLDVVFCVVVTSAIVPGATVRRVTRRLGLESSEPAPQAVLEITSTQLLAGDVISFRVSPASAVAGSVLADVPLPPEASVLIVVRDRTLIAARGETVLQPGDHAYLFCHPRDRPFVELLFGAPEEE